MRSTAGSRRWVASILVGTQLGMSSLQVWAGGSSPPAPPISSTFPSIQMVQNTGALSETPPTAPVLVGTLGAAGFGQLLKVMQPPTPPLPPIPDWPGYTCYRGADGSQICNRNGAAVLNSRALQLQRAGSLTVPKGKSPDWNTKLQILGAQPQSTGYPESGMRLQAATPKAAARVLSDRIHRPRTTTPPAQPHPSTFRLQSEGGVDVALTPSLIDNDYYGDVQIKITGLAPGETVRVKKFQVFNSSGTLDASALLVQSLTLTDGQNAIIGGITNFLAAADTTGTDGTIVAQLSFLDRFSSQIVGKYVYEVSSPANRFAPITSSFTVTEHAYPQGFVGTVRAGGEPEPNAYVVLLDTSGGTPVFVAGTVTDAAGKYHLSSVPGSYQIVPMKQGMVGNMGDAGHPRLAANASLTTDLELHPAHQVISGSLTDAANPAVGLGGVQVLLTSDAGELIAGYTDSAGRFSVDVSADYWSLFVSSRLINQSGYVAPAGPIGLDTTVGDATGVSVPLPRANALIYGKVETASHVPAVGVDVGAFSLDGAYGGFGTSDPKGNYVVAVNAGVNVAAWSVGAFEDSSTDQEFLPAEWSWVAPTPGGAVSVGVSIYPATANLAGVVTDGSGAPVSFLPLELEGKGPSGVPLFTYCQTDQNGKFNVRVSAGFWLVRMDAEDAYYYLGESYAATWTMGISVKDGQTVNDIPLTAQKAPRELRVSLKDSRGNPVSGIGMVARASSGGKSFQASGVDLGEGKTAVPVFEGDWTLELYNLDLSSAGYAFPVAQMISVSAGGKKSVDVSLELKTAPLELFLTGPVEAGGALTCVVTGPSGQNAIVETSSDLTTWRPLVTIQLVYGQNLLRFQPDLTNSQPYFFRAFTPAQ